MGDPEKPKIAVPPDVRETIVKQLAKALAKAWQKKQTAPTKAKP